MNVMVTNVGSLPFSLWFHMGLNIIAHITLSFLSKSAQRSVECGTAKNKEMQMRKIYHQCKWSSNIKMAEQSISQ